MKTKPAARQEATRATAWCVPRQNLRDQMKAFLETFIASFFRCMITQNPPPSAKIDKEITINVNNFMTTMRGTTYRGGSVYRDFPEIIQKLVDTKYSIDDGCGKDHSFQLVESFEHLGVGSYKIVITDYFLWLIAHPVGPLNLLGALPTEADKNPHGRAMSRAIIKYAGERVIDKPAGTRFYLSFEEICRLSHSRGGVYNIRSKFKAGGKQSYPADYLHPCFDFEFSRSGLTLTVKKPLRTREPSQVQYDIEKHTDLPEVFLRNTEALRGVVSTAIDEAIGLKIAAGYERRGAGYAPKEGTGRISDGEEEFLDYKEDVDKTTILRQYSIGRYIADGYSAELNKIYEFFGDYYHGNPDKFARDKVCKSGRTMGEEFDRTMEKIEYYKAKGYEVEWIWENDWNTKKDGDGSVIGFLRARSRRKQVIQSNIIQLPTSSLSAPTLQQAVEAELDPLPELKSMSAITEEFSTIEQQKAVLEILYPDGIDPSEYPRVISLVQDMSRSSEG